MRKELPFTFRRIITVFIIPIFFILISSSVWAQVGRPSKVFYVNLYSEKVDVRLGDSENYVFNAVGLDPNNVTYYSKTYDFGEYVLYFKLTSEDEWQEWTDEEGYLIQCPVKSDEIHSIIIGPEGAVDYYSLTADRQNGAKVCFINGADAKLSKMEIGVEFDDNDIAYIDDFDPLGISNFVTIEPGTYSLFWQFLNQKINDDYYFYPGDIGTEYELFDFEDGGYYVFLAYTFSREDFAILYEITSD